MISPLKQVNFSVILHTPRIIIKDNFNKTDRLIQLMLCLLFLLLLQKRTYRLVIHTVFRLTAKILFEYFLNNKVNWT